ncbi:unnamed protein product [Rotaria sp. Silwood2]|nr:unnamed protein product [Rotaria sp. Silwood2]
MSRLAYELTVDEAAAIYLYTMLRSKEDQTVPIQLNKALRSRAQSQLIPWFSYLQLLTTAINKLPSVKGTIWRCAQGDITTAYENDCV